MKKAPTLTYFLGPQIAERDGGWKCHYCGCDVIYGHQPYLSHEECKRKCHVDHVIPRADGGTDELNNLVLACQTCNLKRGRKPYEAFLQQFRGNSQ